MEAPPRAYVELLRPALDIAGQMTVDDVCGQVANGLAQLWLVVSEDGVLAAALTEVVVYPKLTAVRVVALGGEDLVVWYEKLFEVLCEFARAQEATRLETVCRPGLERMVRALGVDRKAVVLYKEIPINGRFSRYN